MLTVDSNIWAYYLDSTTPEHERVRASVRKALKQGFQLIPSFRSRWHIIW